MTVSGIESRALTARTISRASGEVAHQRRAGAALEDLVRRAAHVDVADVGPELLDDVGRLGHALGVRAVDLDRERPLLVGEDAASAAAARCPA